MGKSRKVFTLTEPKLSDIAEQVDAYYTAREQRLAMQREVDEFKKGEDELKQAILATLEQGEAKSVGGRICRVTLVVQNEPTVTDWDALYDHIRVTGEFELLYRRVNSKAIKEHWDGEEDVPGVGRIPVASLSVNKL